MKPKHAITIVILLAGGLAASAYWISRPAEDAGGVADGGGRGPDSPAPDQNSQVILVGGIQRPASDVRLDDSKRNTTRTAPKRRQGFSPAVTADQSEDAEYVLAKLQSRDEPSAYSSFATAKPFDAESYGNNPEEYLSSVEPGRVFAPAQPSAETPVISVEGKRFHRLRQSESVRLSVKVAPGAPVTFASQDLGQFENQLTSITVQADAEGVATAVYTASGGTIDLVQVLAASPLASGQVAFTLNVSVPENR